MLRWLTFVRFQLKDWFTPTPAVPEYFTTMTVRPAMAQPDRLVDCFEIDNKQSISFWRPLCVCACVCRLSAVLLYSNPAPWLILLYWVQDWAAQLLTCAQSCSQLPGSLPPSQQFKISSGAGWLHTNTALFSSCGRCTGGFSAEEGGASVCSGLPGHTQCVWYSLSHVFTDTQAVCQSNLKVCATDLACKDWVVWLIFSTNLTWRFIFSFCTQMGNTSVKPSLTAGNPYKTFVSTGIKILANKLIIIW